jgi:glycogen operon protein
VRLAGDLIGESDERGEPIVGDTLLLLLNAHHEAIPFTLPLHKEGQTWELLLDTAAMPAEPKFLQGRERYDLQGRSMAVLRTKQAGEEQPTTLTPAQVEKLLREARRAPVAKPQPS